MKETSSKQRFQKLIFEIWGLDQTPLRVDEEYEIKNPAYDWKGGSTPDLPENVCLRFTQAQVDSLWSEIKLRLDQIPDAHLVSELVSMKKSYVSFDYMAWKYLLLNQLRALGYPGQITSIEAIFDFKPRFVLRLWPNEETQPRQRIPVPTEFSTQWQYFLNPEGGTLHAFRIRAQWKTETNCIDFHWRLDPAVRAHAEALASKEIFNCSAEAFGQISSASTISVPIEGENQAQFLKLKLTLVDY